MTDKRESISEEMMRLAGRMASTTGHERLLWRKKYHAAYAEFLALTAPVDEASSARLKDAIQVHKRAARYGKHKCLRAMS